MNTFLRINGLFFMILGKREGESGGRDRNKVGRGGIVVKEVTWGLNRGGVRTWADG